VRRPARLDSRIGADRLLTHGGSVAGREREEPPRHASLRPRGPSCSTRSESLDRVRPTSP
jgi:hypothetical protein